MGDRVWAGCLALAAGAVGRVFLGAVVLLAGALAGAEPGGGMSFFSGFFTLEFRDIFGFRVPEAGWGGDVPLMERRLLD